MTKYLFPFILISILFFLRSVPHGSADEQYITSVCAKTTLPEVCKSVLMSDPKSTGATTVRMLINTAFRIALESAQAAQKAANNLSNQYTGKPQHGALSQCAVLYEDMVISLTYGKLSAGYGLFGNAVDSALSAEGRPDACGNEFVQGNMEDLLMQSCRLTMT